MVSKARHYRAVERQKQAECLADDYPVCLDYPALSIMILAATLIGFLFGILMCHNK